MKVKIFLCSLIITFSSIYLHANKKYNDQYELVKLKDDSVVLQKVNNDGYASKQAYDQTYQQNNRTSDTADYNTLQKAFTLYTEGNLDFINRNYQSAISLYTQSINLNATVNSYYNRALAYSRIASSLADTNSKKPLYEQSIADYTTAIRMNPNDASLYNNRGVIYAKLGLSNNARKDFYRARDLAPDDLDVRNNIGRLAKNTN